VVVIVWKLDLQLPMQSVPITTKIVIQHYVIKFVIDLRQSTNSFTGFINVINLIALYQ